MRIASILLPLSFAPILGCTVLAPAPLTEEELLAKAEEIHARAIVLDTHVDIGGSRYATPELDPGQDNPNLRCDLVKMERGDVDGVFLAVFVGQRGGLNAEGYAAVYERAIDSFAAIHRLPRMHPDRCAFASSPAELEAVLASGRRAILIGIENGYLVGENLDRLAEFHSLGARYITLAHTGHNQICDSSSPDEPLHGGLSDFGRDVVREMNRLGIMVDVSHISEAAFWDVLEVTDVPIIASHSGCSGVNEHDRNLTDEQLVALAKNGGTLQIVALGSYLRSPTPEHVAALDALQEEMALPTRQERQAMTEEQREALTPKYEEYRRRRGELSELYPGPSVIDLVDHIEHAVQVAGIDHVGIGSDFDGGGGVPGFENMADARNVTIELLRRGYSEKDIAKIWGGNLLRVWREVERASRSRQGRS